MANLDSLTAALNKTSITPGGVSFADRGLKLDDEKAAEEIVKAINECTDLHSLNLQGNTLGIEAAKAISKALESHSEFKRALCKDLFTGRMKDEIPIALKHLGDGLLKANARLTELDLSDNAFGPIGMEGLAMLLRSSCCYELQELRLNNTGMGVTGGKMLASALLDCYNHSKSEGRPLALKVFIAGRNRLENPGSTALAEVFRTIGTLEEIAMPQNGIYHIGITALSEAFKKNVNLQIINLNDNTIGCKGARALAKVIPRLTNLRVINFGDCLLKTKGVVAIAESLHLSENIEEIYLDCNEVRQEGAVKLVNAIEKKVKLKKLSMNGNCFGEDGCSRIVNTMQKFGKANILESLSEDEGEDEDDEDSAEVSSDDHDAEEDEDEEEPAALNASFAIGETVSVQDFLASPSPDKLLALGEKRSDLLLTHAKTADPSNIIESYLEVLMNVASVTNKTRDPVRNIVIKCCEQLCVEIFGWGQKNNKMSIVNNTMMIFLKLIKSEDKKFLPKWDVESCFTTFESIVNKNYFPESTRDVLKYFIEKDIGKKQNTHLDAKKRLLEHLR